MTDSHRLRVAVVYHVWPHYRRAVMQAMDRCAGIEYDFYGRNAPYQGIEPVDPASVHRFVDAPFWMFGPFMWQFAAFRVALSRRYAAVIYLADQHFIATWLGAALARLTGKRVLFWSHGWLRRETAVRRRVRNAFHALAHCVMVYSRRSRSLGTMGGFDPSRVRVIYNSLDLTEADRVVSGIEAGTLASVNPRELFDDPQRPLLVYTGRLTRQVRLDLLLDAADRLVRQGRPVNIALLGDGPERAVLEAEATRRNLAVRFYGACYNEDIIGPAIYYADIVVAPGKIGLSAIHALMYGAPAITHDDFDRQMPEVEAIEPGRTGAFFHYGAAHDLARAIADWLDNAPARAAVRVAARQSVHERWNPETQAAAIERCVIEACGGSA